MVNSKMVSKEEQDLKYSLMVIYTTDSGKIISCMVQERSLTSQEMCTKVNLLKEKDKEKALFHTNSLGTYTMVNGIMIR